MGISQSEPEYHISWIQKHITSEPIVQAFTLYRIYFSRHFKKKSDQRDSLFHGHLSYCACSASAILNLPMVRRYLETFIQDREYLLKQKIISLKARSGLDPSSPVASRSKLGLSSPVRSVKHVIYRSLANHAWYD